MIKSCELFDFSHSLAGEYLEKTVYPFEILGEIKSIILSIGASLPENEYNRAGADIWIHKSASVASSASIDGPCIIGAKTEIRHCAFIRGTALIGENCVVGNSAELKNCILFDNVQVPHYNYVGDSIFGYKAHMGAGAVTSNVKSDRSNVSVRCGSQKIDTGRYKCGAMLGDYAEIGCNCVLNPGTVIGRKSSVYPLSSVRGTVPGNSIYKSENEIVKRV